MWTLRITADVTFQTWDDLLDVTLAVLTNLREQEKARVNPARVQSSVNLPGFVGSLDLSVGHVQALGDQLEPR